MKVVARCGCGQEFVQTPKVEEAGWINDGEFRCFKCGGRAQVLDDKHRRSSKVYIHRLEDYE